MDRIGYEEEQTVSYFQTDSSRSMSPSALLSCLQDCAVRHSDSIGFTLDYMEEHKRGWAVTNWHLRLYRMPSYGEKINIQTWSSRCRRFQAERAYYMFDEKGNKLLDGASRWMFMDLEARKPANVPQEMAEAFVTKQEPAIENEKFFMPKEAEGEPVCDRELTVTRRDTDSNGHANNVKYLEWIMDDVPDAIYDMHLRDMKMVYRKECVRGDTVRIKTYVKDTEEGKEVFSLLWEGETRMAEALTLWQE